MGVEEKGVREWHYSGLLTSTQNGTRLVLLKNPRISFVMTKIHHNENSSEKMKSGITNENIAISL